jgi:hypothetical protein
MFASSQNYISSGKRETVKNIFLTYAQILWIDVFDAACLMSLCLHLGFR